MYNVLSQLYCINQKEESISIQVFKTSDEHNWPIFNRIRFGTFVQQAIKFGVSFLPSPRKPKNSNVFFFFFLLCMSENIPTPWSCFLTVLFFR